MNNDPCFKYAMIWSDFEIPQFFIIENSKHMKFNKGYVTNVTF